MRKNLKSMESNMKFCPMCGTIQSKSGLSVCEFCDYSEKPFKEYLQNEIDELMLPYKYELTENGVRIIAVKNARSMRGAIAIPHFVTEISANAFADCKFLSRIELPNGLRSIGNGAFAYCGDLFDVFIPASVEYIGKGAFSSCYELGIIDVAVSSQPDGWDSDWLLDCSAKVEWSSIDND